MAKKESGEFITPEAIADLVGYLGANLKPKNILDPACGMGKFITSFLKYSKELPSHIKGIDINKTCTEYVSETFKLNYNVVIESADSLSEGTFSDNEQYDLVMCNPPFGGKHLTDRAFVNTEIAFLEKCLTLLKSEGYLLIVVPEGVLFRSDTITTNLRKKLINEFNLIAVFSLPLFAYAPFTSIKSSILFIQNSKPSDKSIIFGDFKDTNFNKEDIWECILQNKSPKPPLFLINKYLIKDEIQLHNYLPIEYKLGIENQEYPFIKISEIAEIIPIKDTDEIEISSLILRRVGNFKVVSKDHLENLSDKTIKNYSLLKLNKDIDIDFLKLIFESNIFQKQVESISRGVTIKLISNRDVGNILIPLPPLEMQRKIAEHYRKIEETLTNTEILKDKVLKNPFSKEVLSDRNLIAKLESFSDQVTKSTLEDLPSPIAIVLRQTKNIVSGKDSLCNSVALFETLIKFMVILPILESYQRNLFDNIAQRVGENFNNPSIGKWFAAFKNITKEIINIDEGKGEIINSMIGSPLILKSKDIKKIIEDAKIISIRNDYLGHGAVAIPDEIYKINSDKVEKVNNYLLNELIESLRGYKLIYILNYKKKDNRRFAIVKKLTGENRDFLTEEIEIPVELDTEKVILVSKNYSNYLTLDPLLHLGVCSECGSENLFFYDKRDKEKVQYFSHLHSHKTSFDLLEGIKRILNLD